MLDHLRPLPRKQLLVAWRALMAFKEKTRRPLNTTQALQCRRLLEYLNELPTSDLAEENLTRTELLAARKVMRYRLSEKSQHYVDFAEALARALKRHDKNPETAFDFEICVLDMMSQNGHAAQALEKFYEQLENWPTVPEMSFRQLKNLRTIMRPLCMGLVHEDRLDDLHGLMRYLEQNHDYRLGKGLHIALLDHYAERDAVAEVKKWFQWPSAGDHSVIEVWPALARFAKRNSLEKWANSCFRTALKSDVKDTDWPQLVYSSLILGHKIKDVIALTSPLKTSDGRRILDAAVINASLSAAAELKDEGLANEIMDFASAKGIVSSASTYFSWLCIHMANGNTKEANIAFNNFKNSIDPEFVFSTNVSVDTYAKTINEYLLFLCREKRVEFTHIIEVLDHVDEADIRLDPSVAAELCLSLLKNEQFFDVLDILAAHAFLYSEAERQVMQQAFLSFCLDLRTSTARAWSAYQILQQYFPDMALSSRVEAMQTFFDRKRPDYACEVFSHMRNHRNKAYHPTEATYIQCLEGLAKYPHLENVELLHRYIKTDVSIRPTTKLFTHIMNAYTAANRPLVALEFWLEITSSPEGPGYDTLLAVFWALEKRNNGAREAQEIWDHIEKMDVEVSPSIYNAYVGALAGSGYELEVQKAISNMAAYVGAQPDAMT